MGVYMSLENHTKVFQSHQGKAPIIINDENAFSDQDTDRLNKLIYTKYSGDLLSNIPACECGEISGEYNLGAYCTLCGTNVSQIFDQDLIPLTWIRSPNGVAPLCNPTVWIMLRDLFTIKGGSGYNLIQWLTNTDYKPPTNPPAVLNSVMEIMINGMPIQQGYNYFVENFHQIIYALMDLRYFKSKREKRHEMMIFRKLIDQDRDCLFSRHLPIPHRSIMIVEENSLGIYVDNIVLGAGDAIKTLAGIDTPFHVYSTRVKENRTVKTIDALATFYEATYKDILSTKEGIFRKHVFATRSHFSFRAVITSMTGPHDHRDIHIPWGVATGVFRMHLMNKLLGMGYTPNEGFAFIDAHAAKYHPLLDQLFEELIAECPNGRGFSALLNRNPSLTRSSFQHVYIAKVKKDPTIPTVDISILVVRGLNADFDGDATQFSIAIDQHIEEQFENLAPYKSTFGLEGPRSISGNLSFPKPVVSTMANWHSSAEDPVDPVKRDWMAMNLTG